MTAGAHWVNSDDLSPNTMGSEMQKNVPMGRWGEPEEVAAMVLLLASTEGSYVGLAVVVLGTCDADAGLGQA
jgi:NAD(P)-dependent dehydrogenase (short-subunit alcohol dehydrogenase family)